MGSRKNTNNKNNGVIEKTRNPFKSNHIVGITYDFIFIHYDQAAVKWKAEAWQPP